MWIAPDSPVEASISAASAPGELEVPEQAVTSAIGRLQEIAKRFMISNM
jgi:hypothetical protein